MSYMFDDQQNSAGAPPANLPTEPVDMFAGVEEGAVAVPTKIPDALSSGMLKRKGAETPKVSATAPLVPVGEMETAVPVASLFTASQPILGKILMMVLILLALGGIGWGGWWIYSQYVGKTSLAAAPKAAETTPAVVNIVPPVATPPEVTSTPAASVPTANQPLVSETPTSTITTNIKNDTILFGEPVDSDKDGLDDAREKELGTNPNNPDTDGDGLTDGQEVLVYHTNPLKADTDGDGLSDADEVLIWKTDPLNPDTDGDGYPDGEEVQNGYNPLGRGRLVKSPTSTVPVAVTSTVKK